VGTAKQAQMVMGLSEYELLRAQMGMGMGIPAHSGEKRLPKKLDQRLPNVYSCGLNSVSLCVCDHGCSSHRLSVLR
jgi:hypothetical protein